LKELTALVIQRIEELHQRQGFFLCRQEGRDGVAALDLRQQLVEIMQQRDQAHRDGCWLRMSQPETRQ
jgi:hypothetical protein